MCVCTVFHATLFPKFTMKCGHVKEFFSLRELSYGFGVGIFSDGRNEGRMIFGAGQFLRNAGGWGSDMENNGLSSCKDGL